MVPSLFSWGVAEGGGVPLQEIFIWKRKKRNRNTH